MKRRALWLLLPIFPWVVLSAQYIYPRSSPYSDLTISHIPNALYLMQYIRNFSEIPFWSNSIYSGYPFAANPLSGLWYPPGWLSYLLPVPLGFNWVVLAHILWGAVGVYVFLLGQKLKPAAAVCGALGFAAMPKIFAHFAAGHVTLIYAVGWSPWLLYAAYKSCTTTKKRIIHWILPGALLGIISLADIRWVPAAGAIWFLYSAWLLLTRQNANSLLATLKSWVLFGLAALAIWVGAAFIILAPLGEFTLLSTRAAMATSDVLAFSLPIEKLLGLLAPDFGGYAEWVIYPGAMGLLMTIYCLAVPGVRKRAVFWLVVLLGAVLISLGDYLPVIRHLASLPGVDLLRVPTRVMFLGGLAATILLAYGIDDLLDRSKPVRPDPVFFMVIAAGFVNLLFLGMWIVTGDAPLNLLWAGIFLLLVIAWAAMQERGKLRAAVSGLAVPAIILIDLVGSNFQGVEVKSVHEIESEGQATAEFLAGEPGKFRIYTPSNSLPQLTAARYGLEMVNGIDPMQLRAYAEFMEQASGVAYEKYSVTLPPFESGDPSSANRNAHPDAELLGLLNVKYLAAEFPVLSPTWIQVRRHGATWIYENPYFRPRAWIQTGAVADRSNWQDVKIINAQPGRVKLSASGPGLIVLSDIYYPGWEVRVNGTKSELVRVANVLMGVEVGEGVYEVEFLFNPGLIRTGAVVSALMWGLLILLMIFSCRRQK